MKLRFGQAVSLWKVTDVGKGTMEPAPQNPGDYEFDEIPNPTGGTGENRPWLVLKSDQAVGMSKPALLAKDGVTEIPDEPAPTPETTAKGEEPTS